MRKKIQEKRMQEVYVTVGEKIICDCCSKEITDHYWHLMTGHNDWGNDSCESIKHFDLCSTECARKIFEVYIKESGYGYNSMYFEIEHINNGR